MTRIPSKQLNDIKAYNVQLDSVTLGTVSQNYDITTELNSLLSSIDSSLVNSYNGSPSVEGLVTLAEYNSSEVRNSNTHDPLEDESNNELYIRVSRRFYSSGVTMNLAVGYCTRGCSLTNGRIRYVEANDTLEFSNDGGTTYGDPVDVSSAVVNDVFILKAASSPEYIVITITGTMPVADITDPLTLIDTKYNLGFFHFVEGVELPWRNDETINVDFYTTVALQPEKVPFDALMKGSGGFLDVVAGSTTKLVVEQVAPTGLNVPGNLGYVSQAALKVKMFVNGSLQPYGAGKAYTISGQVVTWNAANAGFALEATDEVIYEYFRI